MSKKTMVVLAGSAAFLAAGALFISLEKKLFGPQAPQDVMDADEKLFSQPREDYQAPPPATSPADVGGVVAANTGFALAYYSALKENAGNIFFSPFSVSAALAMTYEGARGRTAEEMLAVFHFPEDEGSRRAQFASLFAGLNMKDKPYALSTANALWAQKDYKFSMDFFKVVKEYYGGVALNLDFVKAAEISRASINDWVESKTNGRIRDLIPQGSLNDLTRLVLTNAVYFKGSWLDKFDETFTENEPFRLKGKKAVKVPLMRRRGAKLAYAENELLQALEMPYAGEELSMLVLLPKNDDMAALEASLTPLSLSGWLRDLRRRTVHVFIPKFKFDTKYFMAEDLKEMGMPAAFSAGEADFSGMTGERALYISQVIHQAFVEVNEEGTEAAAATAVVMGDMASAVRRNEPPVPVFRADHPFIFLIRDTRTGCILFLGRVSDPRG